MASATTQARAPIRSNKVITTLGSQWEVIRIRVAYNRPIAQEVQ
jgi:hypothetical protein